MLKPEQYQTPGTSQSPLVLLSSAINGEDFVSGCAFAVGICLANGQVPFNSWMVLPCAVCAQAGHLPKSLSSCSFLY